MKGWTGPGKGTWAAAPQGQGQGRTLNEEPGERPSTLPEGSHLHPPSVPSVLLLGVAGQGDTHRGGSLTAAVADTPCRAQLRPYGHSQEPPQIQDSC